MTARPPYPVRHGRSRIVCLLVTAMALEAHAGSTPAADGKKIDPKDKAAPHHVCVEAHFGSDHAAYLKCLNQDIAAEAQHQAEHQQLQQQTVDGGPPSSPTALGLYNQTATRQRLGRNFGHSARPPQPPPPQYVNPLLHH
jgi:hypothetical protein